MEVFNVRNKTAALSFAALLAVLPSMLMAIVSPEVFNERAEKSKIKGIATVKDVSVLEEKGGVERRLVAFKLERRIGEDAVPEEFVGTCSTVVKGKPQGLGETLFFNPKKGQRVFVTISEKDTEISSMTPVSPRLLSALEKTPGKVKFSVGLAYVDDGADAHLEKGEELLRKKSYMQAIGEANKAIQICPVYDKAYHLRGKVFEETGKYDSAEKDFGKAIELNPEFLDAYYRRGICKVNQNRAAAGIEDLNKVIDADPDDLQALYCRATAYKFSGQSEKALADYKAVQDRDKDNHIVARQIAFIHYESGAKDGLEKAEAQFAKALESNPDDMYAAIFLHIVKGKLKKQGSPIAGFAARHKDSDEWPMPAVNLFAGTAGPEKCLEQAAAGKAVENGWRICGAYYYIGQKSLLDGDPAKAAESFRKCLETKDVKALEYLYAKKELESLK